MSANEVPSNAFHQGSVSNVESLDELLVDENFFLEFVDLINQNFVMEVEASHKIR